MDHRSTSIRFLRSTGLIPVKVRPGQKDPFPEWDPRRVELDDHALNLRVLETETNLNVGALFSGKYVDIDVDTINPFVLAALDYFLPPTSYIWGRKSKPRSHRVYALTTDFDRGPWSGVLRYLKDLGKDKIDSDSYSVEVRGGTPKNGLYTVLPGSFRRDVGEAVEWAADIDPTIGGTYIEVGVLLKSVRLAIVAAIIAPHWNEGVRNDLSMALAGTLWRIRTSTMAAYGIEKEEEPPEGCFLVTENDAKAIFECIMKIAGDDEKDRHSRLLNLTNSWRKLDGVAGVKVTGGKVMAELIGDPVGPRVVKAIYRLLSDNDAAEQIEALTNQFVMWYGQGVLVDLKMVLNNQSVPWMTKMAAANSLGGKKITIGDTKVPMVNMLFDTPIIDRVYGLTFDPAHDELIVDTPGGLMVNQWRGFQEKPCSQKVSASEVKPFLDYIMEVIADGQEERSKWVLAWLADIFQNPADKIGTALVLVGVEGAGKTFLGEHLLGPLIGKAHSTSINSINSLTGNFNTIIDNKLFVQCDEAIHSYQKDAANRLKSIITGQTIPIEPKGINSYEKPNHMRLLFTSNEEHAALFISASNYERRFTVLRVSPCRAGKSHEVMAYWTMMVAWFRDNRHKIMRYLLDLKYDREFIRRPLDTEAKRVIQRVGVDIEVSWMLNRIAAGFPISENVHERWFEAYHSKQIKATDETDNVLRRDVWPDTVLMSRVEEDFRNFTRSMGKQVYTGSVATTIKRVLPNDSFKVTKQQTVRYRDRDGRQVIERVRLASWPPEEAILNHLRIRYGSVIDQSFEDARGTVEIKAPMADVEVEF